MERSLFLFQDIVCGVPLIFLALEVVLDAIDRFHVP